MRISYLAIPFCSFALAGVAYPDAPAAPASPDSQDVTALYEVMRRQAERIEMLEQRLLELEESLARQESPVHAERQAAAAPPEAAPAEPAISWKGGPVLASPDGQYFLKLRGRSLADAWAVSGDPEDVTYPSGTEVRSVRLGVEGQLGPVLAYKTEADFAGNSVTIKEAYLQYRASSGWALRAGNFKPHVSLENLIGSPQLTFMERGLPNVFAVSQEVLGIAFLTHGRNWSLGAGVFGEGPGTHIEGNEGYGAAARLSYAPVLDGDRVVHLGASGYHKYLGKDAGRDFRLRQRPETHLFSTRLLDTGTLAADSTSVVGIEFAGTRGPFSLQAEYLQNHVDYSAQAAADFQGGYAYLSWLATGESRPYSVSAGKFGGIRPNRPLGADGWGALEFAIRYSTLDLDDGSIPGGTASNFTLGINWYLSQYARLMFNWVHFDVDDSAATLPFGLEDHDGNAFGVRAQVTW